MKYQEKKIIIAGGSSGIGLAAALFFASEKARVTVTGRNTEKLKLAEQAGLETSQTDSADRSSLGAFFRNHGQIDHLVIAVSGNKGIGNFSELSLSTLQEGFEQKFFSQLHTIQAALPYMNRTGSITLITAISAIAKLPGTSGLAAINGALENMVPILAKEFKPLRINAVSPGVVDTPWWDFLPAETRKTTFAGYAEQIAVGRVAQPNDIVEAIAFLVGNEYMTGKVIACDGGLS